MGEFYAVSLLSPRLTALPEVRAGEHFLTPEFTRGMSLDFHGFPVFNKD